MHQVSVTLCFTVLLALINVYLAYKVNHPNGASVVYHINHDFGKRILPNANNNINKNKNDEETVNNDEEEEEGDGQPSPQGYYNSNINNRANNAAPRAYQSKKSDYHLTNSEPDYNAKKVYLKVPNTKDNVAKEYYLKEFEKQYKSPNDERYPSIVPQIAKMIFNHKAPQTTTIALPPKDESRKLSAPEYHLSNSQPSARSHSSTRRPYQVNHGFPQLQRGPSATTSRNVPDSVTAIPRSEQDFLSRPFYDYITPKPSPSSYARTKYETNIESPPATANSFTRMTSYTYPAQQQTSAATHKNRREESSDESPFDDDHHFHRHNGLPPPPQTPSSSNGRHFQHNGYYDEMYEVTTPTTKVSPVPPPPSRSEHYSEQKKFDPRNSVRTGPNSFMSLSFEPAEPSSADKEQYGSNITFSGFSMEQSHEPHQHHSEPKPTTYSPYTTLYRTRQPQAESSIEDQQESPRFTNERSSAHHHRHNSRSSQPDINTYYRTYSKEADTDDEQQTRSKPRYYYPHSEPVIQDDNPQSASERVTAPELAEAESGDNKFDWSESVERYAKEFGFEMPSETVAEEDLTLTLNPRGALQASPPGPSDKQNSTNAKPYHSNGHWTTSRPDSHYRSSHLSHPRHSPQSKGKYDTHINHGSGKHLHRKNRRQLPSEMPRHHQYKEVPSKGTYHSRFLTAESISETKADDNDDNPNSVEAIRAEIKFAKEVNKKSPKSEEDEKLDDDDEGSNKISKEEVDDILQKYNEAINSKKDLTATAAPAKSKPQENSES